MIERVVQDHHTRYPGLQIRDLCKLLHQAALGSEHAVSDRGSVERWMTRELAEIGEGPVEPLVDPISHNRDIVRIHLRPYVAAGHDPRLLLDAFIRTANDYHGESRLLEQYLSDAIAMNAFSAQETDEFFHEFKWCSKTLQPRTCWVCGCNV